MFDVRSKSFAEIQRLLSAEDWSSRPALDVAILRNVMLEPIEPYLRFLAAGFGFSARVRFGEYDNVLQDASGGAVLDGELDCVSAFLLLDTLSPALARGFAGLDAGGIDAEIERVREYCRRTAEGVRGRSDALLLWHGFEPPLYPAFGIADRSLRRGQGTAVEELNAFLQELLREIGSAYFVDLGAVRGRLGSERYYDQRYWHIGRAPYSREALREIAVEDAKYLRALKGKNKKCLVLDCDNVLWGGIVGEDGVPNLKLGQTHPGSAFYEFQQEALNLFHRGVLLALCSKNNEDDVWEVFDAHPDMVLKRDHIAAASIGWHDKAEGLARIAEELNIGLDSLVFADDSEFEVEMVRKLVPEVETIHLPPSQAVKNRDVLASCGWFDALAVSEEDRRRGSMYKAESERKKLRTAAADLDDYLKSLEMELDIRFADELSIPRAAQLTQKTNQFNLTTLRCSESDIARFSSDASYDVLTLRLRDRFGDSGLVGVGILRYEAEAATIEALLLSCRVLGRGVEDAFLRHCLKAAGKRALREVIGVYRPTAKNAMVRTFFLDRGFAPLSQSESEERFRFDLGEPTGDDPAVFKRITSEISSVDGKLQ